jgi:Dihydropteroate synthase and related enzymes
MGILNVTPDSFYAGSRYEKPESILPQVERMLQEGADFIDVGGYSSRPNARYFCRGGKQSRFAGDSVDQKNFSGSNCIN